MAAHQNLPDGWVFKKLGECVRLINGRAYSQHELLDAGTPVIRIQNLNGGDRWYYSDLTLPDDKYCVEGDLLFAWSASFGPYIWRGPRSIFHYHIWRVLPFDNLDKAFAFHLLEWITERVKAASHGVAMLHMTKSGMENWEIPLPPLDEQRRIAAILDQADALRAKRREALAQLDELQKAIFIEMFGDPATNPKGWPTRKIGDLLKSASYGTSEKSAPEGSFPVLRMNNITRTGEIDMSDLKYMELAESEYDRYLVRAGDVLFNRTNSAELVGKTAVYRYAESAAYAGYLIRLRTNSDNDPEYLGSFLNTNFAKRMLRGMCKSIIGMANINATEIQSMKIAQPPLATQQEFGRQILAVAREKSTHRKSLAELDELFASLQYRAFRGEL